jgi:hypothetical protein
VQCRSAKKKLRYEHWTDKRSRKERLIRRPPGGAVERIFLLVVTDIEK